MPYAMKITYHNIDVMIENAKRVNFNLESVKYDLEDAIFDDEDLYEITDGDFELGNTTFINLRAPDFFKTWRFLEPEVPNQFTVIAKVTK